MLDFVHILNCLISVPLQWAMSISDHQQYYAPIADQIHKKVLP